MTAEKTYAPIGYFITFTTYGTWLHGNEKQSVWRDKDNATTKIIASQPKLKRAESKRMKHKAFVLDKANRNEVMGAISEVCRYRNWDLFAIHARSNHIHAVVSAHAKPDKIMNDFKVYATRKLRRNASADLPERLWTRHGSTRYLWNEEELETAVRYVRDGQGEKMAFDQIVTNNTKPRP